MDFDRIEELIADYTRELAALTSRRDAILKERSNPHRLPPSQFRALRELIHRGPNLPTPLWKKALPGVNPTTFIRTRTALRKRGLITTHKGPTCFIHSATELGRAAIKETR